MNKINVKSIARGCLLAFVVLGTFELCARLQDDVTRGIPFWKLQYVSPPIYVYGGDGPHGIPYAHDGKYVMNSRGFRGPELQGGRIEIVCLGASETFGVAETNGYEYPRQLERSLNASAPPHYQVVNAAIPGERLEDIVATLPATLRAVRPRYAVLYPTTATVAWTRAEWDQLHPTPASKNPPPEVWSRVRIHSRLATIVRDALPPAIVGWLHKSNIAAAEATRDVPPPTSHLPPQNLEEFRSRLERAVAILEAADVKPILVTHATRFGPNEEYRDSQIETFEQFYPVLTERGLFDAEHRMNDVIRAVGRAHGDPVVDAADRIAPGPENFADFFHFTDTGSSKMAALLRKAILDLTVSAVDGPGNGA